MGRAIDTGRSMYEYVLEGLRDVPDKTLFYYKGKRIGKSRFLADVDKFCSVLKIGRASCRERVLDRV